MPNKNEDGRKLLRFGVSCPALVANVRCGAASRLLANTDMPVEKVASAVGFADLATFTRTFTQYCGHPPSR